MNETNKISLDTISIGNEPYLKISNVDQMDPFFMSIVSDSNHWMFIASNGGLSAGRKNPDYALFPYYTDDKITESFDTTGSKTILRVTKGGSTSTWEPFSERFTGKYQTTRSLYKNYYGNKILFEEVNHDLKLSFSYEWNSSDEFGFVRKSSIKNHDTEVVEIKIVDGIQNIMPYGVEPYTQTNSSNLVNAYKRSELKSDVGLGIFALSAIIVDRAEPSEALKANIAWTIGLENPSFLLSSKQLNAFRNGLDITQEDDNKGKRGSYFLAEDLTLPADDHKDWMIIANVNQTVSSIAAISDRIKNDKNLKHQIEADVEAGTRKLKGLVSASDGFQLTKDKRINVRHYSNTLFNIMRGGIFDSNYQIEKWDFEKYISDANKHVAARNSTFLQSLDETFTLGQIQEKLSNVNDLDLTRLVVEYLPLKFSRRHGDPSRPWNKFSINTKSEIDGSKILDYEGNWRDIFQNWEALAFSYPAFIEGMIFKFLNASTFDGYNPYRVTKGGFDWEEEDENDPWSYIGYWGDHQIIYLLKFLEFLNDHTPGRINELFSRNYFVYANVPYKIKPYSDIVKDSKNTIEYDNDLDKVIHQKRSEVGADGALITNQAGDIHQVNFLEKILVTVLTKLSNYIPEGGIWMNTQRPEWNDANNALVGNGVSMVTLSYLRRFLNFFNGIIEVELTHEIEISEEVSQFFNSIGNVFLETQDMLHGKISDSQRKEISDKLGVAASEYRWKIYENGFSSKKKTIKLVEVKDLCENAIKHLEHAIRANKREDGMYHAYNIISITNDNISISYLDEMLEGQVAILSAKYLSSKDALEVLDGLKASKLFRPDQYSYILYPNKELPKFLVKNIIPEERVASSELLTKLAVDGDTKIIEKDVNGIYHFHGSFNNANFLLEGLENLSGYDDLIQKEKHLILDIYEEVFNHKAFTGRSGTFFGYEGLGSIYWHMVSKLLLAVMECCVKAVEDNESEEITGRLLEHFYEIVEGIGAHKPPELYGAFPIDPYSHTPMGRGAQQPGMTGQVKEDIISRIAEIGVFVKNGSIQFNPILLREAEFLTESAEFDYVDIASGEHKKLLPVGSIAFTYCQVPIIYSISDDESIEITYGNGSTELQSELTLTEELSKEIFMRTGKITSIEVKISKERLR